MRLFRDSGRRYLARPLDTILGIPSHIAVLRSLQDTSAGATGREISRAAGVAPQATLDALARLEATGMVRRQAAGRAYLFRLNRRHRLVATGVLPLLEAERAFNEDLRDQLRRHFQKVALAGAIFGSAGRGQDTPSSDLDVCLIVRNVKAGRKALAAAEACSDLLEERYGVRLSPIVLARDQFRRSYCRHDALARNIVRDARSFLGADLKEFVGG